MKIYSIVAFFTVCCLVLSCTADDANNTKPNFNTKPEISKELTSKDADTIPGEPVPIKDKD